MMRRESGLDRHVQADHEVSICTYLQHICICIHIYICVCFHTYIHINIQVYISFPISTPSSVSTSASPVHLYLCLHLFLCPQVPMAHMIKEREARQGNVPKYFHFHYPLYQLYREHLCYVWSGSITTSGEAIFPYYPDIHLIVSFLHPARPGLQLRWQGFSGDKSRAWSSSFPALAFVCIMQPWFAKSFQLFSHSLIIAALMATFFKAITFIYNNVSLIGGCWPIFMYT